jgi:hypothetical protein
MLDEAKYQFNSHVSTIKLGMKNGDRVDVRIKCATLTNHWYRRAWGRLHYCRRQQQRQKWTATWLTGAVMWRAGTTAIREGVEDENWAKTGRGR